MKKSVALLLCLAAAACGAPESPAPAPPAEGRAETQNIRNTGNIGVAGEAVADRVDQALDASERHAEEMKRAEDAANP